MRPRLLAPLVLLSLTGGTLTAQSGAGRLDGSRLVATLDSAARGYLARAHLAGLAVAVVRRGQPLLLQGYGRADLENDVPVTPRTVFQLGSMTKQFTAVALHQLAEQGKVDLDADVTTYLSDLETHGRAIPVWRLLDHTSGLAEYTGLPAFGLLSLQTLPRDTIVRLISREPLMFEPGAAMIYDNSGFFLAAMIVARVSGQSFETYLTDHLFAPLGMTDTRYCDNAAIIEHRARGYWNGRQGKRRNADLVNQTWPYGAGSLCSSLRDLVRWNEALHHGRVLSPAEYQRLVTPRPLTDGLPIRYAGGLAIHDAYGRRTIEHGGAINGFYSMGYDYPDDDVLIVVLQNDTAQPPAILADSLANLVFGPPAPIRSEGTPDLRDLAGVYRGRRRGGMLTVRVETGPGLRLFLDQDPTPVTPDFQRGSVWIDGPTRYTFVRQAGSAPELHIEPLWRGRSIYGHYVLSRQP